MNARPVVKFESLSKEFDRVTALRDVSLEIHAGRIVGLLGANGGGKSTLIRHMVGLYLPSRGTCTTLGSDTARLSSRELARIGYVHQEGGLIDWMRVEQLVRYVASYYPNWNAELEKEYLSQFQLDEDAIVGDLSPGQRQMLAILLAIGFEPELLLLDEPAAALDPLARQRFLDLLLGIIQDPNRTILISSHILSDVEKVIDHVVILDQGKVIRNVGLDALQEEFLKLRITAVRGHLPDPLPLRDVLSCRRNGTEAVVVLRASSHQDLDQVARGTNGSCEVLPLSLEEIYGLVMTGEKEGGTP